MFVLEASNIDIGSIIIKDKWAQIESFPPLLPALHLTQGKRHKGNNKNVNGMINTVSSPDWEAEKIFHFAGHVKKKVGAHQLQNHHAKQESQSELKKILS